MIFRTVALAGRRCLNVGTYEREHAGDEPERRVVLALGWIDEDAIAGREPVVTFPVEAIPDVIKALRKLEVVK